MVSNPSSAHALSATEVDCGHAANGAPAAKEMIDAPAASALPPSFAVRNEESANWLVRKIVEARLYAQRVEAWAACEIQRARREEQFFLRRYGGQLEWWVTKEVAKLKSRRKSLKLPGGTVGFRSESPKLVVNDERRLLEWCRRCLTDAVTATVEVSGKDVVAMRVWLGSQLPAAEVEERVVKTMVNRHAQETGEVPPGTAWVDGGVKFYVK